MNRYKISLVVPVYGVEFYIRQFAESAIDQSYNNIQFIFVNDGTKDRSMEILEELIEERFNHLRSRIIIINKENGGLPSARKTSSSSRTWNCAVTSTRCSIPTNTTRTAAVTSGATGASTSPCLPNVYSEQQKYLMGRTLVRPSFL